MARYFSDDFNRADGAIGANWTTVVTAPAIVSNRFSGSETNNTWYHAVWATPADSSDNWAEVSFYDPGPGGYPGVMCRALNSADTHYVAYHRNNDNQLWLAKTVAGSETNLGTYNVTEAAGDTIKVSASGSTITAYYNGTQRIQVTDTGLTSGRYVGAGTYKTGVAPATLDNWSGGDINKVGVNTVAPLCYFEDDFNRADGGLGSDWTKTWGTDLVIETNQVKGTNINAWDTSVRTQACGTDNNFSQISLPGNTSRYPAVLCRSSNTNDRTHYVWFYNSALNQVILRKTIGAAETQLSSASTTYAPGDVLRIEASGSTITGYVNGVNRGQVTDTGITSGKYVGFGGYDVRFDYFDNWSGGDIAPYRVFSDDFNRANAANLGSNWTDLNAGISLVSNQAAGNTGSVSVYARPCQTNDNWSQIQVAVLAGAANFATCRSSNSAQTYYALRHLSSDTMQIAKYVTGTATLLGSPVAQADVANNIIKISAVGSTITGYWNGVQVVQVTDTSITSGQYVGFRSTDSTLARYDNWSGGDVIDDLLWTEEPKADGSVYPLFVDGEVVGGSVVPLIGYVWSPLNLGDSLVAWYDPSKTDALTMVGTKVSIMTDLSGNGNTVSQSIDANRFSLSTINGRNCLHSPDAAVHRGLLRKSVSGVGQPVTVAAVVKVDNVFEHNLWVGLGNGTTESLVRAIFHMSGGEWRVYAGTYLNGDTSTNTVDAQVRTAILNSPTTTIRLNGNQTVSGNAGTDNGGAIYIGGFDNSLYTRGKIGEVIIASGVLSTKDLANLESYLMAKWGIT